MRLNEFRTDEQQLDEILPLIPIAGAVARAAVGGAGRLAGKAAMGVGKAAVKGVGAVAKGAARGVGNIAKGAYNAVAGDDEQPDAPTNNPNATIGTQQQPTSAPAMPSNTGAAPTNTRAAQPAQMGADAELRTGATVDLPTSGPGGNKKFKVTRAQGDDVEIEDPTAKPGEPQKMVYKKDDLTKAMQQ